MSKHSAAETARDTARTTATATAGAVREHPKEAASLVGVAAVGTAVIGLVVLVKVVRSRRVRRRVEQSARRGAFGPGVAAAATVARKAHDRHESA